MDNRPDFILYTAFRSSCSARLRIALNLKQITAKHVHIRLADGEQRQPAYKELNPSGTVPVLTHLRGDGQAFSIPQSFAALEYLEETFPSLNPLLPPLSKLEERANVRVLVNIIACDIQPLTKGGASSAINALGGSGDDWTRESTERGLQAYEEIASRVAGKYSVGDDITMADVCLAPAIWNAELAGVDLKKFPTVLRVYETLSGLDAVRRAHWSRQPDTPADVAQA